MVRDTRRDKDYFDVSIARYLEETAYFEECLKSKKTSKEAALKGWIYSGHMRLVISYYSAGYALEKVGREFSEALRYVSHLADDVVRVDGNTLPLDDYNWMLWTASLAVLLDCDVMDFENIALSIDRINKPDRLVDLLLSHKLKNRVPAEDSYYAVVPSGMADRYRPLFKLFHESDDEKKIGLIGEYLKHWYKRQELCSWYGNHKRHDYFGYWSFEATALVSPTM